MGKREWKMGSVSMSKIQELKEKLVELKLKKRELILAGKNTNKIDEEIDELEKQIKLEDKKDE